MHMSETFFCNLEERETKELMPGVTARTFWGDNMLISHVSVKAGTVIPPHSHPHEQIGVVLSGTLEFVIAGKTQSVKPGDMLVIPGGVEHGVKALTDCVVADIFSPVREEYQY